MSNRISKGTVLAGKHQQDVPGDVLTGIPFTSASTALNVTSFVFPAGAIVEDFAIKIISVAATSGDISVGLATGSSSTGVVSAYVNQLAIGAAGTYVMNASTSHATLNFTYGSYFVASTSAAVTVLKNHVVASTDTYRTLTFTVDTTAATVGAIYPIFHELS